MKRSKSQDKMKTPWGCLLGVWSPFPLVGITCLVCAHLFGDTLVYNRATGYDEPVGSTLWIVGIVFTSLSVGLPLFFILLGKLNKRRAG